MAERWLCGMLSKGPVDVAVLREEAKAAGVAWRTVEIAKDGLGVQAGRVGGFAGGGRWQWTLPNEPGG